MKRRVLTIAAISGTALLLAGCADDTDTADGGSVPETVAIGIRSDIDVFDPNKSIGDIGAAQAFALLYDGLVRTSPDGEITPGLAESWDVTPLGGTFTLREGITCSDGTALTASDIAKSIEYLADPANGSPGASRVFGFGGAKSITADDTANTVTIELNAPNNDMLAGLTNVARIVCPAGLEDPETLATTPLGTGPYELTAQQRGESYTFTLRDDYVAYPEGVTAEDMPREVQLRVVADDSTQANLLTSGELTIANLQGQAVERVQGQEGINEIDSEAWGVTGLAINHDTPVGGNADLRRAIALALDPELYNKAAYGGQAKPASALYTSNMACYSEEIEETQVRGDLDAAAALLDEKGFALSGDVRTNPDGSPLTIRMMQLATNPTEAEYVKDALSQVGLTVELQSLSYNEALENLYTDGWDLITIPYQSGIASPSLYVLQVSGPLEESLNFGRIQNAGYEALVPEALAAETEDARCAAWNDAQEALLAEADLVPLVQVVSQYLAHARRILDETLEYARAREAFGQPIGSFQHLKFLLAELVTKVEVTQAYVDSCVTAHAAGDLSAVDAAKAKWWTAEIQNEVLDHCVQVHGGYGYMTEYRAARAWQDARVTKIWAGSNEIMKELIGRDLGL